MTLNKSPKDLLLDEHLDFLLNAPREQVDAYLAETGIDPLELEQKANSAIDHALEKYRAQQRPIDALAALSAGQRRELASKLGVPMQVITALREHRVLVLSIPRRILNALAELLGQTLDALIQSLEGMAPQAMVRSYKADEKPSSTGRVTFEQILKDAQLSQEQIDQLMTE